MAQILDHLRRTQHRSDRVLVGAAGPDLSARHPEHVEDLADGQTLGREADDGTDL
jgi:hypothetical protein